MCVCVRSRVVVCFCLSRTAESFSLIGNKCVPMNYTERAAAGGDEKWMHASLSLSNLIHNTELLLIVLRHASLCGMDQGLQFQKARGPTCTTPIR